MKDKHHGGGDASASEQMNGRTAGRGWGGDKSGPVTEHCSGGLVTLGCGLERLPGGGTTDPLLLFTEVCKGLLYHGGAKDPGQVSVKQEPIRLETDHGSSPAKTCFGRQMRQQP